MRPKSFLNKKTARSLQKGKNQPAAKEAPFHPLERLKAMRLFPTCLPQMLLLRLVVAYPSHPTSLRAWALSTFHSASWKSLQEYSNGKVSAWARVSPVVRGRACILDKGMHIWFGMGSSPKDLCQKARALCMSVKCHEECIWHESLFPFYLCFWMLRLVPRQMCPSTDLAILTFFPAPHSPQEHYFFVSQAQEVFWKQFILKYHIKFQSA